MKDERFFVLQKPPMDPVEYKEILVKSWKQPLSNVFIKHMILPCVNPTKMALCRQLINDTQLLNAPQIDFFAPHQFFLDIFLPWENGFCFTLLILQFCYWSPQLSKFLAYSVQYEVFVKGREEIGQQKTLIFLLKFLRFRLLLYLSILSFFSSGLYLQALLILSMMLYSFASELSDRWLCCFGFIHCFTIAKIVRTQHPIHHIWLNYICLEFLNSKSDIPSSCH